MLLGVRNARQQNSARRRMVWKEGGGSGCYGPKRTFDIVRRSDRESFYLSQLLINSIYLE